MNIISEIEKDSKQFMREAKTLMLMAVAPLLILFILGAVFSGSLAQVGRSAIGICDLDNSNASQLFISGIKDSSEAVEYIGNSSCAYLLEKDIKDGKLAAGIVIPNGFEQGIMEGKTQKIALIVDNSRFQVSPTVEAFIKAAVQETDQHIGEGFILSVWAKLDDASAKLEGLSSGINETRQRVRSMRARLAATANSLSSLNISGVREEIYIANSSIYETQQVLDEAEGNLTEIESDFADYAVELEQTEADLAQINETLSGASLTISLMHAGINCSDPLYYAYCLSLSSLESKVNDSKLAVETRLERVRAAKQNLAEANETIQVFKARIYSARNSTYDAELKVASMLNFVDELEQNRISALETIAEVNSSLNEIEEKTYYLENIITSSRAQIAEITSRSPSFVISPMLISTSYIFGERQFFGFMLPSLLPLIMMFVALFLSSIALVREKQIGTLMRIYAAQVNPFEFAATKALSYTIVLIPEALLLSLVASIAYGAFPLLDIGAWSMVAQTMALLVFTFCALGVLIAIHSDSESTAFLASLVVGLPLLFLSGLLFPFEFMPSIISFIGMAMPLSQAVISMQSAILYASFQPSPLLALAAYGAFFTLLAGASLRK
ncbi:MAG: ABC transporter permease [Candidatus Anstonellales archaeon]